MKWAIYKEYRCLGKLETFSERYYMDFQTREHAVSRMEWIQAGNEIDWFNPHDLPPDQDPAFEPDPEDGNTVYCYDTRLFVIQGEEIS